MDIYDTAAVQTIWERVRRSASPETLEETLAEWIACELADCEAYRALAKCGFSAVFRALANDEACHARKLSALYFLLTGCRPAVCPAAKEDACLRSAVRSRFAQELKGAEAYRAAAAQWPAHAALFCALANDEARHACRLREIAERLVCAAG